MTPEQIKEARRKLGLSVAQMARLLDTDSRTMRRMEQSPTTKTARGPAPRMVRLINAYLDGHRPEDWADNVPAREKENE